MSEASITTSSSSTLKSEQEALDQEVKDLEQALVVKKRRLEKLSKVQESLANEPPMGSVIRFSRTLAGSSSKYTFLAYNTSDVLNQSWYLTGRANALRLLGLNERGNTWEDLVVAIGNSEVEIVSEWSSLTKADYHYYRAVNSGKVFRFKNDASNAAATQVQNSDGSWRQSPMTTRGWLELNTGSYRKISAREVR